ncbi:protein kinase domain-containing protein [Candidatus Ferrigenium straubiae]|jgi:AAA+ superfamily predicted ATPase|uniref:protein kinase domain-containing protein n=1 Tax=Candidatus Ferrigenium straubiae TaxID=2919506 RepID=UPI003F4AE59D
MSPATSTDTPQKRVGDFALDQAPLQRDGFKTVYAAGNLAPQGNGWPQRVAVCIPHAQDEEARALLEHELRAVRTLQHPGIATAFGIGEADGCLFAVAELVQGESLDRMLERRGPLPLAETIGIAAQAGAALDYAHQGLTVHRDIRPSCIVVQPDGAVKILGFGLTRLMKHSKSARTATAYLAPEQFGDGAGCSADLWGLAVIVFEALTGKLPFNAPDEEALKQRILYDQPDLSPLETGAFDVRLPRVIAKALEKDPEQRYKSAAEFVADLRTVARHAAMANDVEGRIEVHLRAHFPLLWLQTHEEERALASLLRVREAMAAKKDISLYVWSATRGLCDREGKEVAPQTAGDPVEALEHVFHGPAEAIYVFLDMQRHFTPVIVRLIRDAVWTVKHMRKSLVFVGASAEVPEELGADATLFYYPPPDLAEMERLADEVAAQEGQPAPDGKIRDTLARALLGLTRREAERVLRRGIAQRGALDAGCAEGVLDEKEQTVRKDGVLEFCRPRVSFADVGGLEPLKNWFARRRQAFDPEGLRFGLRPPRGVVLAGVPGCGKSLTAKALAADWEVPLLRLDLGKVYGSLLGESEDRLRRALSTAEAVSPCVLWIDELEKAFSGLGNVRDNGVARRLFGTFLTWLEDRTAPVFVAATANDIQHLPPEFTRKGRFDEIFFVDLPSQRERASIFNLHLARRGRDPQSFDVAVLAEAAKGYSGAEIEAAVVDGLYRAFDDGARPLAEADIRAALEAAVPLAKSRAADIARLHAWAEENARPAQVRERPGAMAC